MKKIYSTEQKLAALRSLEELGFNETCVKLNIPPTTLYRWKKLLRTSERNTPDAGSPIPAVADDANSDNVKQNDNHEDPAQEPIPTETDMPPAEPAPVEEVEVEGPVSLHRSLQNNPEQFAGSIIVAIRQLFEENDSLKRENTRLRQALRTLLDSDDHHRL